MRVIRGLVDDGEGWQRLIEACRTDLLPPRARASMSVSESMIG